MKSISTPVWTAEILELPLRYSWNISRNSSTVKYNLIVRIQIGNDLYYGEAAPNVRYGETIELLSAQWEHFLKAVDDRWWDDADQLHRVMEELNLAYALRFGIESAYVHARMDKDSTFFKQYTGLDLHTHAVATSYTIPILDPGKIQEFITSHDLTRFESLKIKTNSDNQEDMIKWTAKYYAGPLRIDANEAWTNPDDLLRNLEFCKKNRIEFIEQPFPSDYQEEYKYLKPISPMPVFADESVTHHPQLEEFQKLFHGINMKLMKAGSYREGAHILLNAKRLGFKTMVGCMVETTLGIRSGVWISGIADYVDLDGCFVIDNERFNLVSENRGRLFINSRKFFL
ncbi:MAG: dipeptide epimerase [Cytophagaceae bacterium]|jgi:glutamate racemase|nr:dipeptide epimerase [Cytophagaceae bacterium]